MADERRSEARPFTKDTDDSRRITIGVEVSPMSTTGHTIDPNGVNHPRHYNLHPAGIECIDVIEYMTANIAFTIKHLWRAGLKEGEATLKDVDKALWYLNRERARLVKMGVE